MTTHARIRSASALVPELRLTKSLCASYEASPPTLTLTLKIVTRGLSQIRTLSSAAKTPSQPLPPTAPLHPLRRAPTLDYEVPPPLGAYMADCTDVLSAETFFAHAPTNTPI